MEKSENAAGSATPSNGERWLNPANMMTALRVVLAPPIVALLLYQPILPYKISYTLVAGLLFVLAALTDKADGYYARKNNAVTSLGAFLDPLADKLLMIPVMVSLWYLGRLPLFVLLVVLIREIAISVLRFIGKRRGVTFAASKSGKIKMFSHISSAIQQ